MSSDAAASAENAESDGGGAAAKPFRSTVMTVEDGWLDYNNHLNMAFYGVLFDRAVDEFVISLGLGPDYLAETNASFFTAETHTVYLRELPARAPVHVDVQVLATDAKRLHVFEELHHAEEGFLSATLEQILLHVDMAEKRVTPWPDDVLRRLEAVENAHKTLPVKPQVGRVIGIPGKRPMAD